MPPKKRRTELVRARARIFAGMKEKHDEEILDEAFQATEAIRGELNKSLQTLRKTLTPFWFPPAAQRPTEQTPTTPHADTIDRNRYTS